MRVAIAGSAHAHVEYALSEVALRPELELVGVSDPFDRAATEAARRWGAPIFADHRDLLEHTRPDVVVTAGIYRDRGAIVLDALEAGCDVVADKPLCISLDELDAIEGVSAATQRSVTLLLEKRDYPETLAAIELLQAGTLGKLVEVNSTGPHKLIPASRPAWFFDRRAYGGILADLTVHDIDLALLFTGAESGTVTGLAAGTLPDHPGFMLSGAAIIQTPDQAIVSEVNWLTPASSPVHGDYHLRLLGTHGVLDLWWARHQVIVMTGDQGLREVKLPPGRRPAEAAFDALLCGSIPDTAGRAAFLPTRLALSAQASAEDGGRPIEWTQ